MEYYTVIIFISIFALLAVQLCVSKSNTLDDGRKRLFHLLYTAIIVAAFCEWLGVYLQGTGPQTRLLHTVIKAVELSVAPSIAVYVADIIEKGHRKTTTTLLVINCLLQITSGVGGFIYRVDENSVYTHGDFYWLYILAYLTSIAYCVYVVAHNVRRYQYNGIGFFLSIAALQLVGIVVQMHNSELRVDFVTLAIGSVMLYVFTLEMITQTDELTGLINRRGYENSLAQQETECVIVFFDVDRFKAINDTYGHAFGDVVLSTIGETIKSCYARHGRCYRYGGDEFCVITKKNVEMVEHANALFYNTMQEKRKAEPRLPFVSVGYAHFDPRTQTIQDAIHEADQMMYQYKEAHR